MVGSGLTPEQLEARRKGITSTDIAAIMGVNPWRSALQVWREKRGEQVFVPDNVHLRRGRHLEPAIRTWYAEEVGAERIELPGTVVSLDNPLIIATPDGVPYVGGDARALEIKAPRAGSSVEGWGAPGTDQVPAHYLLQTRWHLMATGFQRCDVAALRFGELCLYEVNRNAELEGIMLEHAERFWRDNVLGGQPPPAIATDSEWLRSLYPTDTGKVLLESELAPDVHAAALELLEAHAQKRTASDRYERLAALVQQAMGEHTRIEGDGWSISWKANKPSKATDWKGMAEVLLGSFEGDRAELLQRFTTTKKGARPFTPRAKGEA
jgi:putative phage-type endonuclease